MGRRKIEIQPITHERNRSVTFLKRKNGLFKKAYELGVLCSVDVAVIIFEQRPGHNVKLYQYCSADAQDIVQRHVRFDGEKDTRGPADFSGAAAVKVDETVEGDEDEPDDDDDLPTLGSKRRNDGSKPGGDLPLSIDVDYRARQQPRPTSSSALPLSSDRTSPASKKARIAPMLPPGRTGASDSPGGFSYTPSMRGAGGGQGYNTPYYPPLSSQTPFAPSFESFAAGARGQGSRAGYPEYPLGASSRGAGQRGAGAGVGDPFGGLLDDDARQQHGMGGAGPVFNWPVHTGSSAGGMRQTAGGSGEGGGAGWMDYLGGGRGEGRGSGGRGRSGERAGSRGRVIEELEYEVKKEG